MGLGTFFTGPDHTPQSGRTPITSLIHVCGGMFVAWMLRPPILNANKAPR